MTTGQKKRLKSELTFTSPIEVNRLEPQRLRVAGDANLTDTGKDSKDQFTPKI